MIEFGRPTAPRIALAFTFVCAIAAGAFAATKAILPAEGYVAHGVIVGGETVLPQQTPDAVAEHRATRAVDRKVTFQFAGKPAITTSLTDLGARVHTSALAHQLEAIGRDGDLLSRILESMDARSGEVNLRVPVSIEAEKLADLLARFKEENDLPPVDARLVFGDRSTTAHAPGKFIDVYAALNALDRALLAQPNGDITLELPTFSIEPRASADVVKSIDITHEISHFETKFGYVGGQQNRAGNIQRAASQMDGVVLMPGEVVSFNAHVGPRSTDNGFFPAPEIYKGEMREGIGGGTCQVAGTLHAAAFFGGLEIVERSPHSRPSGYIRMGLDATVVYPTTDLKLKNPYSFPVIVHAVIDKGTLRFSLLGSEKPVNVDLATDTVASAKFKRKIEEASWLPAGKFVLKQKGITGHTIKKRGS
ncbi:MAG: VanW family protein [Polyangiaceae bacterium]|nr:VanW family protein [Polyangiaceae bacterium]